MTLKYNQGGGLNEFGQRLIIIIYKYFFFFGIFDHMSSFSLQQLSKHTYPSACVNLVHCMDECILTPQSHTLSHTVIVSITIHIFISPHKNTYTRSLSL